MKKLLAASLLTITTLTQAQSPASLTNPSDLVKSKSQQDQSLVKELKYVVVISRHGVRSPTGKLDTLSQYSRQSWPKWSAPAGYLTEHGAKLMTLFGAYDRELFASEGLLAPTGCADAEHIHIVADSDQRTRETGRSLAAGLAPGCKIEVTALEEGVNDPLFHPRGSGSKEDNALAVTALAGRIGDNPQGLTESYRPQLTALEEVLLNCKPNDPRCTNTSSAQTHSLFDIPASLAAGKGDHSVELSSPLSVASTMTENFLLEYTEGMDAADVGWGRVDLVKLRELLQLHVAAEDISLRTSYLARAQSSNLLDHVLLSVEQAGSGHAVAGSLDQPGNRLLILVGHDTNLASIAGALSLNWLIDGRRDDTPPGGALVFELWKTLASGAYEVKAYYTAQTLDQMRNAVPLSLKTPPERVPVFIPGCGQADGSCTLSGFEAALKAVIQETPVNAEVH
jgi:4-phytase / acid phosphatase